VSEGTECGSSAESAWAQAHPTRLRETRIGGLVLSCFWPKAEDLWGVGTETSMNGGGRRPEPRLSLAKPPGTQGDRIEEETRKIDTL
jgi:hypothetical protein